MPAGPTSASTGWRRRSRPPIQCGWSTISRRCAKRSAPPGRTSGWRAWRRSWRPSSRRALAEHFDSLREDIRATAGEDRLARVEEKLDAADPNWFTEHFEALRKEIRSAGDERLARVEERLQAANPDWFAEHFETLRNEIRVAADERLARLEQKLETADPELFAEHFAALRTEIRAAGDDRLASIEKKLDAADPGILTDHLEILRDEIRAGNPDERLARLEKKLDAANPDRVAALLERMETSTQASDEERFARLEQKIEMLGRSLAEGSDGLGGDELSELRGDIGALRRELRSLADSGRGADEHCRPPEHGGGSPRTGAVPALAHQPRPRRAGRTHHSPDGRPGAEPLGPLPYRIQPSLDRSRGLPMVRSRRPRQRPQAARTGTPMTARKPSPRSLAP